MRTRFTPRLRRLVAGAVASVTVFGLGLSATPVAAHPAGAAAPYQITFCEDHGASCTEPIKEEGQDASYYVGHDEPSALFYSNTPGSGNSNVYTLKLPSDPKNQPSQDGSGTTWNFQLHPAFWFGMAMCDNQSAPNPAGTSVPSRAGPNVPCAPDSDTNIYTDPLGGAKYIGQHPGSAFMEMQFYPPSWAKWPAGNSCDPTQWCAALNIDSFSRNSNFPVGNPNRNNNLGCLAQIGGTEYVNFAFITKNGVAQAPANPKALQSDPNQVGFTPDPVKDLFMGSGDTLTVDMHDTAAGFQVNIQDQTSGQSGSMTASVANGFGQIQFAPSPSTACNVINQPFHPMYSTSSENTRVVWAAHSYNVAFSDEIGHFEYCNVTDGNVGGNCVTAGVTDPGGVDGDDFGCFNGSQSSLVPISGCLGTDFDFDGPEYGNNWPGTGRNYGQDKKFHSTPIQFTSPLTNGVNFDRVAFETDLPAIEGYCNVLTGAGCTNPPLGPDGNPTFYPFFSTGTALTGNKKQCVWDEGGPSIKDATNTFGGSSTTAFGPLVLLDFVSSVSPTGVVSVFEDYRNIVPSNPCAA
jgi:hypothetical protein